MGARSAPGGPTNLWLKQQKLALPQSQGRTSETEASAPQRLGGLPVLDPTSGGSRRLLSRVPITPVPAATFTWLLPVSPSLTGTMVIKLTLPHPESLTLT